MKISARFLTAIALVSAAVVSVPSAVRAQECFIGEVRMFAGNFAPRNWAFLDGQLLPISQNQALFSILGTTYGGDGRTTFALPDMRARGAVHPGQGPGLSNRRLGSRFGSETLSINEQQLPSHSHGADTQTRLSMTTERARRTNPENSIFGKSNGARVYTRKPATAEMAASVAQSTTNVAPTGGGQPIPLAAPSLAINHIICLQGIFPSRS